MRCLAGAPAPRAPGPSPSEGRRFPVHGLRGRRRGGRRTERRRGAGDPYPHDNFAAGPRSRSCAPIPSYPCHPSAMSRRHRPGRRCGGCPLAASGTTTGCRQGTAAALPGPARRAGSPQRPARARSCRRSRRTGGPRADGAPTSGPAAPRPPRRGRGAHAGSGGGKGKGARVRRSRVCAADHPGRQRAAFLRTDRGTDSLASGWESGVSVRWGGAGPRSDMAGRGRLTHRCRSSPPARPCRRRHPRCPGHTHALRPHQVRGRVGRAWPRVVQELSCAR
jgi:hypothetical protein